MPGCLHACTACNLWRLLPPALLCLAAMACKRRVRGLSRAFSHDATPTSRSPSRLPPIAQSALLLRCLCRPPPC